MNNIRKIAPLRESSVDADGFLPLLQGVRGRDLADAVAALISEGQLPPGARLPTVREVSLAMGVSTGTVAAAWNRLQSNGMIQSRKRGGTTVLAAPHCDLPPAEVISGWPGEFDLVHGVTDTNSHFPDAMLEAAFVEGLRTPNRNDPAREYITDRLVAALQADWPFPPEAWTTVSNGSEATVLSLEAASTPGAVIAVEQPTSPRILEALASLDVRLVGVACDEGGPVPEALATALGQGAQAFIYQPRAQVPLGHTVGAERIEALARVIAKAPGQPWIVEDDNIGPIAVGPILSLGRLLPDQTIYIRAFCKTYGADLRTSIVTGPRRAINRLHSLRSHGQGMTSRILQDALAHLIANPDAQRLLDQARQRYARKRSLLQQALAARGIPARGTDGVMLWVPVRDETQSIVELARRGISVAPGSRCFIEPPEKAHIRIATTRLPGEATSIARIAASIADVLQAEPPAEFD